MAKQDKKIQLVTSKTLWQEGGGIMDIGEVMCFGECCEVCKPGDSQTCTPGDKNICL